MSLKRTNPHLKSANLAREALWVSAKTSSTVEGIRQPFIAGLHAWKPATAQALIDHWKRRAAKSGR